VIVAGWRDYSLPLKAAMAARMAAIAPKTISSQIDAGPRKEFRITQIPIEQIDQLISFNTAPP